MSNPSHLGYPYPPQPPPAYSNPGYAPPPPATGGYSQQYAQPPPPQQQPYAAQQAYPQQQPYGQQQQPYTPAQQSYPPQQQPYSQAPQPGYQQGGQGGRSNYGGGGGRGGYSSYGQSPLGGEYMHDTVFVSNLPETVTESEIAEYFGSIGIIKKDKRTGRNKIWIYTDKVSGAGKGEATVTYDDPPTAKSCISWFNGKDFRGKQIKVELAQRRTPAGGGGAPGFGGPRGGGSRGGSFGGRGGHGGSGNDRYSSNSRGGGGREGDWKCPNPSCENNNFAWRTECNRCQTQRPDKGNGALSSDGGAMHPEVVDSRRSGGGDDYRRNGGPGMRGGRGGRDYAPGGGFRGRGRGGGGDMRGGGRGGAPMRGGRGGPMRGGGRSGSDRLRPY